MTMKKEVHIIPPPTTTTTNNDTITTTDDSSVLVATTTSTVTPLQQLRRPMLHLDHIMATTVWCSHIWSPIPSRSIGFAIGPFKVVDDPEYIHQLHTLVRGRPDCDSNADDDDEEDDDEENGDHPESGKGSRVLFTERQKIIVDNTMKNGEGIRQVF